MISIITSRTLAPPQQELYILELWNRDQMLRYCNFLRSESFWGKKQILHLMFHFISITGGQRPEFLINTKQISPALHRREMHSNKKRQISPQGVRSKGTSKKLLKMTPAWLSISVKNSSKYVVFFWEDEWKLLFAWACQNFVLVQNSERDFIGPL